MRRMKLRNVDRLKELYLYRKNKSADFRALVLLILHKIGDVNKVSELTEVPQSTIYEWKNKWNRHGNLERGFSSGRKPKLSEEQKRLLRIELSKKEYWTTDEIRRKIYDMFNITYSSEQVRKIIKEMNMILAKGIINEYDARKKLWKFAN